MKPAFRYSMLNAFPACVLIVVAASVLTSARTPESVPRSTSQFTASPATAGDRQDKSNPAAPAPVTAPATPQKELTARERRAQAYMKLLEAQRHYAAARGKGFTASSLQAAQQSLQEAIELDPTLAEAHTALAEIAFFYLDDIEKAEREAASAVKINGNNLGARRILSRIYTIKSGIFEGNPDQSYSDKAITELREVVRLSPNDAEALALLGEIYMAQGRETQAIEFLTRWAAVPVQADGSFFRAVTKGRAELSRESANARLGEALLRSGRTADAIKAIRWAVAGQPENPTYVDLLGRALETSGAYEEAVADYEKLLKARGVGSAPLTSERDKRFAAYMLQRIVNLRRLAGQTNEAMSAIERMRVVLGNDDPAANIQLVELLREQSKYGEALEAARAARAKHPDHIRLLYLEAATLADLNRVDDGVALLRSRLKGDADDYNGHVAIASLYLDAGRAREAVESARRALELSAPDQQKRQTDALILLSSAQERAGDSKGSEESLRRVLAAEPNNATALNNLGYFLVERNDRLDEALEMINRAVRAEPANASFLDSLGWAYFKLGKLQEAERYLSDAARRNPSSVAIQEHLGDLYQKLGKTELARAAWQKALSFTNEAAETARIKAKLNSRANDK